MFHWQRLAAPILSFENLAAVASNPSEALSLLNTLGTILLSVTVDLEVVSLHLMAAWAENQQGAES